MNKERITVSKKNHKERSHKIRGSEIIRVKSSKEMHASC
jgi:hypothetical protein